MDYQTGIRGGGGGREEVRWEDGRERGGRQREGEGREREVELWQIRTYEQKFGCLSEFNGPRITLKVYSTI